VKISNSGRVTALVVALTASSFVVLAPNLAHASGRGDGNPGRSGTSSHSDRNGSRTSHASDLGAGEGRSPLMVVQNNRGRAIWFNSSRQGLIHDHQFQEAGNLSDIASAIHNTTRASGATIFGFRRVPGGSDTASWHFNAAGLWQRNLNTNPPSWVGPVGPSDIEAHWGDFVYRLH